MSGGPAIQLLAAAEVAGRHAVRRFPALRRRAGRWARRQSGAGPDAPPAPTLGDLGARLADLGVTAGEPLLVHASWDGLRPLCARPSDLLAVLRGLVGAGGTLLMPTHPAPTSPGGDVPPVYDVARSPSTVGLLSETLRRAPGARRSPCPVAPVAVLGAEAEAFTGDFRDESGGTAYGRGSPYQRLAERRGKVLALGVDLIRSLTLMHVAFDLLGDANPVADYYRPATFTVVRGGARGESEGRCEERWTVRVQRPDLEDHFASAAFARMVAGSGTARAERLGEIPLAVVDAAAFVAWHLPLARAEGWPYWGFRRAAGAAGGAG